MDSTHLHLILNHFPIIGTFIGTLLLLFGVWKGDNLIQKISLATIFTMALIAIPVFLTGEPAEESIEKLPGVIESITEEHEEASEVAFWFMMTTGFFSIVSIGSQLMKNSMMKLLVMFSLGLSLITSVLMARAGYLGGQIRHTEIRSASTGNLIDGQGVNESEKQGDGDDD